MSKVMSVKERNKLPSLLLNEERNDYLSIKDRVVFWLNKKKAIKQLQVLEKHYINVKYELVKVLE
jgi:hypothetical protein